jgi:hypothetical protein
MLGILAGAALLAATPLSSADAQVYGYGSYSGYGYPAYSYGGYSFGGYGYPAYGYGGYGYGYPAYSYGGYYRPALGGYLGYRIARRVAINRARWRSLGQLHDG